MSRWSKRAVLLLSLLAATVLAFQPVAAAGPPTGERLVGQLAVEPAYDDSTGNIIYLGTPVKAPFPSHTNANSVAPLYLLLYPPGTPGVFNCMGANPGNCPDHAYGVALAATQIRPDVYGTDPLALPGHDHLVDAPGGTEWNVPWHVYLELFTSSAAVRHITTEAEMDAAIQAGDLMEVDAGIEFLCNSVSAAAYWHGTPIGN